MKRLEVDWWSGAPLVTGDQENQAEQSQSLSFQSSSGRKAEREKQKSGLLGSVSSDTGVESVEAPCCLDLACSWCLLGDKEMLLEHMCFGCTLSDETDFEEGWCYTKWVGLIFPSDDEGITRCNFSSSALVYSRYSAAVHLLPSFSAIWNFLKFCHGLHLKYIIESTRDLRNIHVQSSFCKWENWDWKGLSTLDNILLKVNGQVRIITRIS